MTSNEAMEKLNITITTLKEWDRKGILKAKRNDAGWRVYDPKEVDDLANRLPKKRARGLSINQIKKGGVI